MRVKIPKRFYTQRASRHRIPLKCHDLTRVHSGVTFGNNNK